ncbi:MAG TPA: PAS domain S-box protein [Gemmatimonadaceae bacterium]|jgi:PAS domain S-box-containing protein|nr:PAS domain S-box protein [Gemmatimonadaceae bacterium]
MTSAASTQDERFRPLFELTPQPAWVYDLATLRFLDVNAAATRAYGWSREEFLAMTLRDIRPPSEREYPETVLKGIGTVERVHESSVHRTKRGQIRRVQITSYPLEFDGHSARMVLVDDMTEQLAAEQALARSEQKYRTVVEQMQDVFFRADEGGLWTFLNPAWTTLTGHEVDRSLGTHFLNYVHPSDRSTLHDALLPMTEGSAESALVEVRFFHRDGGYRWVEASVRAVREDDTAMSTMGTLRDTTQRRAAAEERQRLATNIRRLLDASGEGIYGLDANGVVTFINRRGSEMLGYDAEELIGKPMHPVSHHSRSDGTPYPVDECPICLAVSTGVACEVDDEVLWRKNGQPLQVEYAASPVLERGRISGAVVNFRDVTARKRAELDLIVARDAAEAASRAKSDFLARMSHELRTPLNSIIGFANVLLKNRGDDLSDAHLSYLNRIAANGRHLLGLINDILDLSKIEAGRMTLELGPVRLDTLIAETVGEFEGQLRDRPVLLRTEHPPTLSAVVTDEARLKQVLINLIGNALKFTERGEVVVRLEVNDAGEPLRLEVRDTGIGIRADRLDAIFNVFEQAEAMINRRFGGTGLGLAISRSLCELMGHRLDAASVEGEGTTMTIHFAERAIGAHVATTMTPVNGKRVVAHHVTPAGETQRTVLIVDDDQDACVVLGALVHEAGHRAVTASSGVEGLRLARELRPALVFLDLRLPRISGFDVLRILRADADLGATPIVITSVVATDSRSALSGAAELLDKPLDRDRVLSVLRRYLPAGAMVRLA